MLKFQLVTATALFLGGCSAVIEPPAPGLHGPLYAAHQHLLSPATAQLWNVDERYDAAALLSDMDRAGTRYGVVFSVAYSFADERRAVPDASAKVRAENDWTSAQVSSSPRLIGFCGINPLTADALLEFQRCHRLPGMVGLKMHFGNSGVDLHNPAHVARRQQVFAEANRLRAPIVIHLRSRGGKAYGPEVSRSLVEQLMPYAPDVSVQIAHLAGSGPGWPAEHEAVLAPLAEAVASRDPLVRHMVFDVTTDATGDSTVEDGVRIAARLRQIGLDRVYFGSDLPISGNLHLKEAWDLFVRKVPLTSGEFRQIAMNRPPYWP